MGKHGEDEGERETCINLPGCGMTKGQWGVTGLVLRMV